MYGLFFGDKAYRGVNSRKRSEAEYNAFESPSIHPLYITTGLGVKRNFKGRTAKDIAHSQKIIPFTIHNAFSDGVVVLTIIPGLEAEILLALAQQKTTKAIILNSLGAGNIPALPGRFNLIPALLTIIHELKKNDYCHLTFCGRKYQYGCLFTRTSCERNRSY